MNKMIPFGPEYIRTGQKFIVTSVTLKQSIGDYSEMSIDGLLVPLFENKYDNEALFILYSEGDNK